MTTSYIMSNGMGVESIAILLRWIMEPETRVCPLEDLIVITSQVGDEYQDTLRLHEQYILPLFRQYGIRYVQVARKGHLEEDGITVLDDSRFPVRMFGQGDYKLSDELKMAGTVPQFGGDHICSQKFKAFVIETWLEANLPTGTETVNHAFGYNLEETTRWQKSNAGIAKRNAIAFGFNVDETTRYAKAAKYDTPFRQGFYPLVEWGWNREACLAYIHQVLGVTWKKSCCVYCPFANNRQNRDELLARHKEHPAQVADAMVLEHMALALNPRSTLYPDASLIQITGAAGNTAAVAIYEAKVSESDWTVYHVRRIYTAKGKARRCVERLDQCTGTHGDALAALLSAADDIGRDIDIARGMQYVYLRRRQEDVYPAFEDYLVAAPAHAETKARWGVPKFNAAWQKAVQA